MTLRELKVMIDFHVKQGGLRAANKLQAQAIRQSERMGSVAEKSGRRTDSAFRRNARGAKQFTDSASRGASKYQAKLRQTNDRLNKLAKDHDKAGAGIEQRWMAMTAALAGATAVVGFSIKAASDATEMWNRFDATLGENADAVRAWAKEYGKSVRLATEDIAESASVIGPIVDSYGRPMEESVNLTTKLTQAVFDLSSVMNLDLQQAQQSIISGMAGEAEALRRYGIMIDVTTVKQWALEKGLINTNEELDIQTQRFLTSQKLLADMEARGFTGDLTKTAREFANAYRAMGSQFTDFRRTLGEEFMVMVKPAVNFLADFLGIMNQHPIIGKMTAKLLNLVMMLAAFPLLRLGIGKFFEIWHRGAIMLGMRAGGLGDTLRRLRRRGFAMLGKTMNWVRGVGAKLGASWVSLRAKTRLAWVETHRFTTRLGVLGPMLRSGAFLGKLFGIGLHGVAGGAKAAGAGMLFARGALEVLKMGLRATGIFLLLEAVFWLLMKIIEGVVAAWNWFKKLLGLDKSKTKEELEDIRKSFIDLQIEQAKLGNSSMSMDVGNIEDATRKMEIARLEFQKLPPALREAIQNLEAEGFEGLTEYIQSNVGEGFVTQLAEQIEGQKMNVQKSTEELLEVIEERTKFRSPPKKGPLKELDKFGSGMMRTMAEGMRNAKHDLAKEMSGMLPHLPDVNARKNMMNRGPLDFFMNSLPAFMTLPFMSANQLMGAAGGGGGMGPITFAPHYELKIESGATVDDSALDKIEKMIKRSQDETMDRFKRVIRTVTPHAAPDERRRVR